MPIEESLAGFLEAYEAVLGEMHRRFKPLLAEWQENQETGVTDDLRQRLEREWAYFAGRMSTVQMPLGATVVNFSQDEPIVEMLKLAGSDIRLVFNYFNYHFDFGTNFMYRAQYAKPLPGSTLTEYVDVLFAKARKVEWVTATAKRVEGEGKERLAFYDECAHGVMEMCNSRGNFWSPKLWEDNAKPLIEIRCNEFHLSETVPYKDRINSITSASFSRKDVGSGEIDAFLARFVELPTLETAYPIIRVR